MKWKRRWKRNELETILETEILWKKTGEEEMTGWEIGEMTDPKAGHGDPVPSRREAGDPVIRIAEDHQEVIMMIPGVEMDLQGKNGVVTALQEMIYAALMTEAEVSHPERSRDHQERLHDHQGMNCRDPQEMICKDP